MLSSAGIFENARDIERAMQKVVVPVGEYIIKQGETGTDFFVIESGCAQVEASASDIALCSEWASGMSSIFDWRSLSTCKKPTCKPRCVVDRHHPGIRNESAKN
jgi:CRP-like cAMP-binding protein